MSNARLSLLVAATATLILVGSSAGRFVQASPADPALPVGSWFVQATPDPGGPLPPMASFAAFTRDGIVINTNDLGSAAIGSWTQVGPRSYAVTFTGFEVIQGQQLRYVVRGALELAGDSGTLDGPFQTDLYAADGSFIASATGSVHGERLTVQPLP